MLQNAADKTVPAGVTGLPSLSTTIPPVATAQHSSNLPSASSQLSSAPVHGLPIPVGGYGDGVGGVGAGGDGGVGLSKHENLALSQVMLRVVSGAGAVPFLTTVFDVKSTAYDFPSLSGIKLHPANQTVVGTAGSVGVFPSA